MSKLVALAAALALLSTTAWADDSKKKVKAPKATAAMLGRGKALFTTTCASCHGDKGIGDGPTGMYLNPSPRNFTTDKFKQGDAVEQIFATLQTGVAGTPMVSFSTLPEDDRWALAYYVRSLTPAKDAGKLRKLVEESDKLAPPVPAPAPAPSTDAAASTSPAPTK